MKRNWLLLLSFIGVMVLVSCKRATRNPQTLQERDSASDKVEALIVENEGEYPRDVDLFSDTSVKERLENLLGEDFKKVEDNFETQTPIVSEKSIFKFTGCKAHDCPSFLTRVYYDANHDNFNVLITRSGKVKIYAEKEQIQVPKVLEVK